YTNLTNCYWYIHPQGYTSDSISGITLFIHEFATEGNSDLLTIYAGPTINHPVLEIISGFDYPEQISTSSNQMLISFKTNECITNSGFLATYRAQLPIYCQDTVLITANAGSLNDGSGSKLYSNNSDCYWLIKTEETDTISLIFTEFDLEYGYDWVEVIDPNASPPILLVHSTGNQIPQKVISNHGAMLIHFHSDISITKPGWEAQFTIGSQNIQETDKVKSITIRPNPATEHVHLDISCLEEVNLNFELINMAGYQVGEGTQSLKRGENTITIDCQNMPAGIYIIKMRFEDSLFYRKVIIQ
ncbi:MAG: T9SS type A sorting domain-containing protein, partial [Bacteroidales bacterium]|nr:T9SS type A sorting domain-containing protein [Bacteroidales bacterium]